MPSRSEEYSRLSQEEKDRINRERYGFDTTPEDDAPEEAAARARAGREGTREMDQIRADDEGYDSVGDWLGITGDTEAAERQRTDNSLESMAEDMPTAEDLTPEYSLLGDSAEAEAYADPEMVDAQRRALAQMEQWARGEMTPADMARRDLMRRELAGDERRSREGVMRGMQERGLGGSGLEVMGTLGAQQGMADRLSAQDSAMQVAVQDRALRAMESAGSLASQGRGQSYDEARGRGSAEDRFNALNNATTNRQADARVQGRADAYQNVEDRTAMQLGQYNRDNDDAERRRQEQRAAGGELLGGLWDTVTGDDEDD